MTKVTKVENSNNVSVSKVDKVYKECVKAFQRTKLSVQEILLVYGNLGYTLGASIGGFEKGPSVQELEKLYAENPNLAIALMLNGLTVTTWIDDLNKTIKDIENE